MENVTSTFYAFLLHNRDAQHVTFCLDNCAAQNKNWTFLSVLIYAINCQEIATQTITLKYFEPGHTFMSADVFHHKVELSLKHQGKTYDFSDFKEAVQSANSLKTRVLEMNSTDFFQWRDLSSRSKLNKLQRQIYLRDIIMIQAERGNMSLKYATSFTSEFRTLNFMQAKPMAARNISKPACMKGPRGFDKKKKEEIISNLDPLMSQNRIGFWMELLTSTSSDIVDLGVGREENKTIPIIGQD